jgi:hypothetical protein
MGRKSRSVQAIIVVGCEKLESGNKRRSRRRGRGA